MTPKLLFVLGKGGVGRTSIATALAVHAGSRGRRALVVELNGVWDIGRRFGLARSYEPVQLLPNVDWRTLTARECMQDFGRRKLGLGMIGARVMASRPMRAFVDAVPGLSDLIQLGKVENLLNEPREGETVYDQVIVDAPATGHGLSLLAAPRSMTELTEAGPFHDLARIIDDALASPGTGVVLTTLAEHLPYTETVALLDELERSPLRVDRVVVNRLVTAPLPDRSRWPEVRAAQPDTAQMRRLFDLVESVDAVARDQEHVLQLLLGRAEAAGLPLDAVPWVPSVDSRQDVSTLASYLGGR